MVHPMFEGVPEFTKLSLAFAYGKDSSALKENRVAGVQVRAPDSLTTLPCFDHYFGYSLM